MIQLSRLVEALAEGIEVADAARPVAVNQRSGKFFLPGIGPHSEAATIDLALVALEPARLPPVDREVPYPAIPRNGAIWFSTIRPAGRSKSRCCGYMATTASRMTTCFSTCSRPTPSTEAR